jgi:hypothetical protein
MRVKEAWELEEWSGGAGDELCSIEPDELCSIEAG